MLWYASIKLNDRQAKFFSVVKIDSLLIFFSNIFKKWTYKMINFRTKISTHQRNSTAKNEKIRKHHHFEKSHS